ncbi:MAG: hypothetical protein ACRYGP_09415 [Janthinobacterium lividum]
MKGGRLSLTVQIDRLAVDLRAMQALARARSPLARGAALATAHAALILAASTVIDEDMQMIRHEALHDAMPILAEADLDHIVPLIEAALTVDVTADRLARGVERLQ